VDLDNETTNEVIHYKIYNVLYKYLWREGARVRFFMSNRGEAEADMNDKIDI
jgi:hypothetical protein